MFPFITCDESVLYLFNSLLPLPGTLINKIMWHRKRFTNKSSLYLAISSMTAKEKALLLNKLLYTLAHKCIQMIAAVAITTFRVNADGMK